MTFTLERLGTFFSPFITLDIAKAMILMAKGKSGKEKALGTFPVYKKKKSTTLDGDVWNTKRECLPCRPAA